MATINILATPSLSGELIFVGSNTVGPQFTVTLPIVEISPSKDAEFIEDKLGDLDFKGEVLADASGDYGTIVGPDGTSSPATTNVYIGKGVLTFGGVDLGNCLQFSLKPDVKKLARWNHRNGEKRKDGNFVNEVSLEVSFKLDEYSLHNLNMMMLGTLT